MNNLMHNLKQDAEEACMKFNTKIDGGFKLISEKFKIILWLLTIVFVLKDLLSLSERMQSLSITIVILLILNLLLVLPQFEDTRTTVFINGDFLAIDNKIARMLNFEKTYLQCIKCKDVEEIIYNETKDFIDIKGEPLGRIIPTKGIRVYCNGNSEKILSEIYNFWNMNYKTIK